MYTEDSEKGEAEGSVYSSLGPRSMDQDNYSRDGDQDDEDEDYDYNRENDEDDAEEF